MKKPRYANKQGGILLEQSDGVDLYVDSGDLYERAKAGEFGIIVDYAPPDTAGDHSKPKGLNVQVLRFQFRSALHLAGLLDQVESLMAGAKTEPLIRIAWQDCPEFFRFSRTIDAIQKGLNLSDEKIDGLFEKAKGIIEA